jgi:hypothetical protein
MFDTIKLDDSRPRLAGFSGGKIADATSAGHHAAAVLSLCSRATESTRRLQILANIETVRGHRRHLRLSRVRVCAPLAGAGCMQKHLAFRSRRMFYSDTTDGNRAILRINGSNGSGPFTVDARSELFKERLALQCRKHGCGETQSSKSR